MLFFVMQLKWGYSLIAGAFTLAIMVLPVIMRTTEEALLAVPDSYREGSFGLGPASVFNSTRTLATHMYLLSNEGLHINETYGTAVVLLILVLLINSLSSFIAGRLAKK